MSDFVVALRITGDASGATASLKLTKDELAKLMGAGNDAGKGLAAAGAAGRQAGDNLRRTGDQARQAAVGMGGLRDVAHQVRGALAAVGISFGTAVLVREALQATIALQGMESRLTRLTGSAERAAEEQEWLQETAKRLSTDLVTVGDNWARLLGLVNGGVLGLGQARQILEGFANVAAATGAAPAQLGQAMYGLGQALSQGRVQAQEYNQVIEPLIGFSNSLDRAWVRLTGSTEHVGGAMRRAVMDGKVTSEMFGQVMVEAMRDYQGAAEDMAGNVQQQLTRLGNEWTLLAAAFAQPATGTGFFDGITDALAFMRENIELTRVAVLGLGAALVLALGGKLVTGALGTLAGLFGALMSPLGLVIAGVTALGLVFNDLTDGGHDAGEAVDIYREALGKMEEARAAGEGGNEVLAQQMRTIAEVAMAAAEAIRAVSLAHYQTRISELRQQLASLPSELEIERTTNPSAGQRQQAETRAAVEGELARRLNDPDYKALLNPQTIKPATGTNPDPETPPLDLGGGKGGDALRDLLEELDPMRAALRALAEDQALLTAAQRAGQISAGDLAVLTAQLKERYREALDPLGTLLDGYRQETQLLALSADERAVQQEMLRAEQALREKGLSIGAAELEQLRAAIMERRREQAASSSRQRQDSLADQLTMLQAEIRLQSVSSSEREVALALLERELQLKREGLDLSSETAQAELEALRQTIEARGKLNELKEGHEELARIGERAFDRIGEAITQAFADGSLEALDFGQLAKAVLSELLQEMLRIAVLNPLKKAFGDLIGGIDFGGLFGGGGVGAGPSTTNVISSGAPLFQLHSGGIAGIDGQARSVDPAVFARARRYHRGGLAAGEVPAILKVGEEVLTEDNPRHRRNGGGGGNKVEVHVHEAPGTKATVRERNEGGEQRLDVLIEQLDEAMAQRAAGGRSAFGNTVERMYGLNRGNGDLR